MAGIIRQQYQTDAGNIFYTLVEDEDGVPAITGPQATGAPTEEMTVKVTKNKREVGLRPRFALLARRVGAETELPNGLVNYGFRYKRVPVFTEAHMATLVLEQTYQIDGVDYTLKKRIDEQVS